MVRNALQLWNAATPMPWRWSGSVMCVRAVHPEKAEVPSVLQHAGRSTETSVAQRKKARSSSSFSSCTLPRSSSSSSLAGTIACPRSIAYFGPAPSSCFSKLSSLSLSYVALFAVPKVPGVWLLWMAFALPDMLLRAVAGVLVLPLKLLRMAGVVARLVRAVAGVCVPGDATT